MASKRDSESLVVGIQLALKGEAVRGDDGFFDIKEVEKEIQFDFKKPLQHALKSVFDHGGKVVLAFPDSTHAQVKGYADNIRNAIPTVTSYCKREQTRTITTYFNMWFRSAELDADYDEFPDINVEIVGVFITPIRRSQLIDTIIRTFRNLPNPRNPTVDVVMLLDPSETQALTVRTRGPEIGQVYFADSINPRDVDAYSFFRVQFFSTQPDRERYFVTIWISLKTLYPIGITSNDELFAVLPESSIFPTVSPSTVIDKPPSSCVDESPSATIDESPSANTGPFPWLEEIVLYKPDKYFFREMSMGTDVIIIHPANATTDRRVTRREEIALVADDSEWEFNVRRLPF